jgi:PadR family transcriptional regulator, regulatory protein PadR
MIASYAFLRPPGAAPSRRTTERNVTHQGLGDFEQMVLLAILHLDGEAYGVPIVDEIERRTGRAVSRAAVYVALRRLEDKGLVTAWMSEPIAERGGKPRRCVRVTPSGAQHLRASREAVDRMWRGLDPRLGGIR